MNIGEMYGLCNRRLFSAEHAMAWMRESAYVVRRGLVQIGTPEDLDDAGLPHFDAHLSTEWGMHDYDSMMRDHLGREYRSTQGSEYLDRNRHSMWSPEDAAAGIAAAMNSQAGLYLLQRIGGGTGRRVALQSRTGAAACKEMLIHSAGSAPTRTRPEVVVVCPYYVNGQLALYTAYPRVTAVPGHPADADRVTEHGCSPIPFPVE